MSAFVWFVSSANAAVAAMALYNTVAETEPRKRGVNAIGVLWQGGLALWGFWTLLS